LILSPSSVLSSTPSIISGRDKTIE
jgi:hypothetical protein